MRSDGTVDVPDIEPRTGLSVRHMQRYYVTIKHLRPLWQVVRRKTPAP